MIMNMGLQECDSFDEDAIQDLEEELGNIEGPSLCDFEVKQSQPIIYFLSKDILRSILDLEGRDFKLIGHGKYSKYQAFFYILLLIGVEQHRNYPHLNTLIRQQFYKPNIFQDSDQQRAQLAKAGEMLQKSLKYFQQISQGVKLEDYIMKEPIFEQAGVIMLRNSVELDNQVEVYEQLAAKFNIDMTVIRKKQEMECYQLGANKRYHIIKEIDYYFVTITNLKQDNGLSRFDLESVRSGESGLQFLIQASEQSTPKFKNSEIKFHKKSHKNSFGGELQNFQYKDLVQRHAQNAQKDKINAKVFSEYVRDEHRQNEVESCTDNMLDVEPKGHNFDHIIEDITADPLIKAEMKGSTTIDAGHHFMGQRRKDRKISASQIIEPKQFTSTRLARHDSVPQVCDQEEQKQSNKGNSYQSVVVGSNNNYAFDGGNRLKKSSYLQGQKLQRIEELQSSQRESTHPEQSEKSEKSSQPSQDIPMLPTQIQVKLKDRKYSYFTQQMASSKSKKLKQIQNSNYVFKLPKPHHKNSQVIIPNGLQSQYHKRRFEDNALRFSQMRSPSQDSVNQNVTTNTHRYRQVNLKTNSSVFSVTIASRPADWIKKEVIYHLPNHRKQIHTYERTPEVQTGNSIISDHFHYSYPVHQDPGFRTSFGSSNSLLSKVKSAKSLSTRQAVPLQQPSQEYNPYQINQNSFLKNRIQSMSHFEPRDRSDDSKSIVCQSVQSLQEIRVSPEHATPTHKTTKIKFNYLSSNAPHAKPVIQKPKNQSFQQTYSPRPSEIFHYPLSDKKPQSNYSFRPISPNYYSSASSHHLNFQNRFFRSPHS